MTRAGLRWLGVVVLAATMMFSTAPTAQQGTLTAFDIAGNVAALGFLSAPPGRDGRQFQVFAKQVATDARHEGQQGPCFENAGAERVDDCQCLIAQRLHHAGRTDVGLLVQFQRIGIGGIEAPPKHADRFQSGHGPYHHAAVDHGQILTL